MSKAIIRSQSEISFILPERLDITDYINLMPQESDFHKFLKMRHSKLYNFQT